MVRSWMSRHSRAPRAPMPGGDRKSTRLNSSHVEISYAVFCLKKKKKIIEFRTHRLLLFSPLSPPSLHSTLSDLSRLLLYPKLELLRLCIRLLCCVLCLGLWVV